MERFAINLSATRKAKKLSQEKLARLVGISTSNISKYERGICTPSAEHLWRISDTLERSMDELWAGIGQHPLPSYGETFIPGDESLQQDPLLAGAIQ